MYFSALLNVDKRAATYNNEIIASFLPLTEKNRFLASHRIGEKVDFAKVDYPGSSLEKLFYFLPEQPNLPGIDGKPIVIQQQTFSDAAPYTILLEPLQERPTFSLLADFLNCDLAALIEAIMQYVKNDEEHTVQSFLNVFTPFDRYLAYTPGFINEANSIYMGLDKENGLIIFDNIENDSGSLKSQLIAILRPFFALQCYAQSYFECPSEFESVAKFDLFCNRMSLPQSTQHTSHTANTNQKEFEKLLYCYSLDPSNKEMRQAFISSILNEDNTLEQNEYFFYCFSYCDLLYSIFRMMLAQKMRLKRCLNCGRIFVALKRPNIEYCSFPSPQDPTVDCRTIGPIQQYQQRVTSNETLKLERKIYNLLLSRRKLHPENPENQRNFESFTSEKSNWKKIIKRDNTKQAAYEAWLKEENEKYRHK